MSGAAAPPLWRQHVFDAATFGPDLFALCRQVPALEHVLCRLDHIHDPALPEDRVLRRYQRELAARGRFELWLPDADAVLHSGRAVMLEDKSTFFGVQGRRDMILAAARVGFTMPLCSVVLPLHRAVVNLHGGRWNIDTTAAQRAIALFEAAKIDWGEPAAPCGLERCVVTGDANYAHHLWNQLGALEALLQSGDRVKALATHQPIAPLAELFDDHPGLTVVPIRPAALPRLDPCEVLPFPAGGRLVMRSVRERIHRVAARRATLPVREFLARAEARRLRLIWLTVRAQGRTAVNLFDALLALGEALLREPQVGIVLDGYSRPNDYTANPEYPRASMEAAIAREQAFAIALAAELGRRSGADVDERIFNGVGCDLLDSLHLAVQCRAYFAHHGTLQHKVGYFTTVPGMAHANPGILATDPAGGHRHVTQDPGVIEYVDRALIDDVVAPGSSRGDPGNAYRFKDIPKVVSAFRDFLARYGLR